MKLGYTALNAPYFFIDSPGVTLNTTYTFEIPLKDGRVGSGVITTQDAQLNLLAPASASTQNNLPISWSTSNHDDMSVTLFFKTNGASNEVQGPTYEPTPAQIAAGAFTIPSVAFERPGLVHVRIVLRGVKLGTTSNFHTGADASSVMTSEKIVEFK
jgi:hypothetical protein